MSINTHTGYRTILRHTLFWIAFALYEVISSGWNDTDQLSFSFEPNVLYLMVPITIVVTYINLYVLTPVWFYPQKYPAYAAGLLLLLFAGGLSIRYLAWRFVIPWEETHNPLRYQQEKKGFWIPVRILRLSAEIFPVVAVTMLFKLMRNAYRQQQKLHAVEKERLSAEMGLLKAQINPHFFFNTLNSLYALTLKRSDQASKVVLRLSALLHYMLYDAGTDKVLLVDEIGHLENYIGIEQMRFADRLTLSFRHSGDIAGKMIAPLLLLPFIENAFKHGLTKDAGWINIDLTLTGDELHLKVENSYTAGNQPARSGIGLANVRRRLNLTYPNHHTLALTPHKEKFEAVLKLDL
jgi:two-component system LytT family sensor kinase